MAGSWSGLQNQPNFNADTMLLLTDGTVMCHEYSSKNWHKFKPDTSGSYINGTWQSIASFPDNSNITAAQGGPTNAPIYFASAVFADGRVITAGGEYNNGVSSADINAVQIYDPVSDSWEIKDAPSGWTNIGDAVSCVLPDGRFLLGSFNSTNIAIYDPVLDLWTTGANKGDSSSEETFTLLPDNTILTAQCSNGNNAEKYLINTDQWVSAGSTPSTLPQSCPGFVAEIGPAILLPNGNVFVIGATGNTAIYTPPANIADAGTWSAGPTLKDSSNNTSFPMDAPAVLLPNGKVLLTGSPTPPCNYPGPTTFFEFDPSTNTASVVTSPSNAGNPAYNGRFLLLPNGQVLFSNNTNDIEVYKPDGNPDNSWKPGITSFPAVMTTGHNYVISGTQINGLSQACSYGDDAQMATNYPIVRFTNISSGNVSYVRTSNHSTMGVATGSTVHSTNITIPPDMQQGEYNMEIVANGIASDPVSVTIALQDCIFLIDRNTYGQGEIQALINENGAPAVIDPALYVVVEGFGAADLGLTSGNLSNPPRKPSIPNPDPKISFEFSGSVIPQDPFNLSAPQRFTFPFRAVFQDDSPYNNFTSSSEDLPISASITSISGTTVSCNAMITLLKNPNPFILHGDTTNGVQWYLSMDVRVFQMKAGQTKFAANVANSGSARDAALNFINQALDNLNASPGSADTEFNALPQEEDASTLALAPSDSHGTPVYNFAIARVRYRDVQDANDVRVFFRMWPAQQTNATYDTNTTYRRGTNGANEKVPLLGIQGDEIITIPFFATPRVDSSVVNMDTQTDATNVKAVIHHDSLGGEVHTYFGCWLDINQPAELLFPSRMTGGNVGTMPDGPFNGGGTLYPIQQLVRSEHQCLLTEISYDLTPISPSADPSTSDKLAQRNLTFVNVPNPGLIESRRVPQTFEIRPTPFQFPSYIPHDEIMIEWGNIPAGSTANVYLPAVNINDVLNLSSQMYTVHTLTAYDSNTIQCKASGVTYFPIPKGTDINFAGLLSIDLPAGIKKGQTFQVTIKQITTGISYYRQVVGAEFNNENYTNAVDVNNSNQKDYIIWRKVLGVFHIIIPVSTKSILLEPEERRLSILRWIQKAIPIESRWYLVFKRYVQQIADRVETMGGDPTIIVASGTGDGKHGSKGGDHGGDHDNKHEHDHRHHGKDELWRGFTGKIAGIIYDHFGDFEGFVLETIDGNFTFRSKEHQVENLIREAWNERILVTVFAEGDELEKPLSIVLKRAPRTFRD